MGTQRIGRGPTCEIKINSVSVSKEHASVLVTNDKVIVTDAGSRNGTFVNGVRVQNHRLAQGDKIALHDVLFDLIRIPDELGKDGRPILPQTGGVYAAPPPAWAGNAAVQVHQDAMQSSRQNYARQRQAPYSHHQGFEMDPSAGGPHDEPRGPQMSAHSLAAVFQNFQIYIDNVAMPGVYKLVQSMPFRFAIGGLVLIYAIVVTAFSTVPIVNTTRENIKMESMRRARTIAMNMAALNRQAVIEDNEIRMIVRQAELEEGVTTAVLLRARDGTVLAPANKRGEFVNKPFVNKARREEKEVAEFIDDSTLGVSIPISVYSSEGGNQNVIAYAIILYDMGALAINGAQTFSLFIQTLAISLLLGLLLYFFLYKIIEHPIDVLNISIDDALRDGRDDVRTDYQMPVLERLIANINSSLSRIDRSQGAQSSSLIVNREAEALNLLQMLNAAGLVINAIDERIISSNSQFDGLIGGGMNLTGRPLTDIPDVALQANLRDLIPRLRSSVSEIATSEIPFAGIKYQITGQTVMGSNEPAYFIVTISAMENSS
jgi:hypothetical protein